MRNCKALLILRSNVAKEDHTIQRIGIVGTKVTWFFKHLRMGKWWWRWVRFLPYPSGETRILELLLWQFLVQVVDLGSASHTAKTPLTSTYLVALAYLSSSTLPLPLKMHRHLTTMRTKEHINISNRERDGVRIFKSWVSRTWSCQPWESLQGVFLQNPCCLRQKLDEENTWEPSAVSPAVQVVTWTTYCRIGIS